MKNKVIVQLFGSVKVVVNGEPLPPLHSRTELWLLVLLILQNGKPIERERLSGILWPYSSDTTALGNLRSSLVRVRGALGPEGGRIEKVSPRNLVFNMENTDVDVLTFKQLVQIGTNEALYQAVQLYSGVFLDGVSELWVMGERTNCEEMAISSLETLAAHARTSGRPDEAVTYLERVLQYDPYREDSLKMLLQNLSDAGRLADVSVAYREFRRRLRNNLNQPTSSQTDALYRALIRTGTSLSSGAASISRRSPATRFVPEGTSRPLPRFITRLVDRDAEVAAISDLVMANPLVTLVGAGGVGKTRLACAVAEMLDGEFVDGVCFTDLSPLNSGAQIWPAIAQSLGLLNDAHYTIISQVLDYLAHKEFLLILDNCEHVLQDAAEAISTLLGACKNVTLITTSRHPLGISGERHYRAPSLGFVGRESGAAILFQDRARAHTPEFAITTANEQLVNSICKKLDGIPLALELAAAQLRALTLSQLAANLDTGFSVLVNPDTGAYRRHRTVESLIKWSFDLLTSEQQLVLMGLSCFAGSWSIQAAVAMFPERQDTTFMLTTLVDNSLVHYDRDTGRYRLLETVKTFARTRLQEIGRRSYFVLRMCKATLAVVVNIVERMTGPTIIEALQEIELERDNMSYALELSTTEPDGGDCIKEMCLVLWEWWERVGLYREGRKWLEYALANTNPHEEARYGRLLLGYGVLTWLQEDPSGAIQIKAALDWAIERDDISTAATAYFYLSRQAEIDRDLELAASLINSCIKLRRQLSDGRGVARAQIMEAHYHYRRENFSEVRRIVERIEAALAGENNPDISVRVMGVLGNLHWGERNIAEARKYYLKGVELCDEISALRNKAVLLDNLARMFRSLNCPTDVISWQYQARQIFERIGNPVLAARAMMWEGVEWAGLGDYNRARALQMEALHRGEQLNRPDVCCLVITFLCRTERYAGNYEALRHWQAVQRDLPNCEDEADIRHKAMCLYELALAEFQHGALSAAEVALRESIELAPEINSDVIPMLCTNAVLLLQLSRINEAASNLKLAVDAVDGYTWPGSEAQILEAGACLAAVLHQQAASLKLIAMAAQFRNDQDVQCPPADLLEKSWAEAALGGIEVQCGLIEFTGTPPGYRLVRELLAMAGAEEYEPDRQ